MTDPMVNGPDITTGTPVPPRSTRPTGEATDSSGTARAAGNASPRGSADPAGPAATGGSRNGTPLEAAAGGGESGTDPRPRRRRGSRGGRNRSRSAGERVRANGADPASETDGAVV